MKSAQTELPRDRCQLSPVPNSYQPQPQSRGRDCEIGLNKWGAVESDPSAPTVTSAPRLREFLGGENRMQVQSRTWLRGLGCRARRHLARLCVVARSGHTCIMLVLERKQKCEYYSCTAVVHMMGRESKLLRQIKDGQRTK